MRHITRAASLLLIAALLCSCQANSVRTDSPAETDRLTAVQTVFDDTDHTPDSRVPAAMDLANAVTVTLNGASVQAGGSGVSVENGVITISEEGTYAFSGVLTEGRILVDAKGGDVTLVLNGADITCSYGSPLYIYEAASATVHVMEGTENALTDGSSYTFGDSRSSEADDEPNACLYSKDDLVLQGAGTLTVNGNYHNGITGKDTLEIYDLTLTVNAISNGINGKDSNTIDSANITVTCGGDAIRSTNDTDANLGWVSVSNSVLELHSGEDGIQAETDATVSGSICTITSGGGSAVAPSEEISAKGIKAGGELSLLSGVYTLDCSDDAIHSNGNVTVAGGIYTVSSGDDAFHADETLTVSGGQIDVLASYEGLEGSSVEISGGEVHLVSSDDGVNAAGGRDSSGFGGWGQGGTFGEGASSHTIAISGGYVVVQAGGDGLDSNGSITMTGGTVLVSSTGNGDGALDCDGGVILSGGTLLAVGSGGMSQVPSSEQQPVIYIGLETILEEGTLVAFTNEEQQFVFAMPIRTSNLVFTSPELVQGGTYALSTGGSCDGENTDGVYAGGTYSGGTVLTNLTLAETVTRYGSSGSFGVKGNRGDMTQDGIMQPGDKQQWPVDGAISDGQNAQRDFQKGQRGDQAPA